MSVTLLASQVDGVQALEREAADTLELIAMAEADGDAGHGRRGPIAALRPAAAEAKRREIESLLSGEADGRDAFLEVNAGAGGTEAQDWAEMLARMYTRWAEARGYKVQTAGAERGRAGRHQVRDVPGHRAERVWLAEDRGRRAPAGAH